MKVSELWLRSLIETPLTISQISAQLTNAGIEVDNLEYSSNTPHQGLLTLKVPPNRGDCLCMLGIARELSLLTNVPYKAIESSSFTVKISDQLPIFVQAAEQCPRYLGRIIKDINAAIKTPTWIKERLEWAGIHSVSVVVDILNYVMIEMGQPLHAFDLEKLDADIIVRKSVSGEVITLLNGQTVELKPDTIIIADKTKPQAIAGVMGGLDASVTESTHHLFIESAYFNPISIRWAATQYGLKTDASHRFERGIDFALQEKALNRATELLLNIVGGEVGPILEQKSEKYLPKSPDVFLRTERILALLGTAPEAQEIVDILKRAEMKVEATEKGFRIIPPSHRHDIELEVDLIEEIARVVGFDRFASQTIIAPIPFFKMPETECSVSEFKKVLVDRGYFEVITYSFIDPNIINLLYQDQIKPYLLKNPISVEMAAMRPSLWPGLIQTLQYNQRRQQMRARLFELGVCFLHESNKITERPVLSGICSGPLYPAQWGEKSRMHDFYDIKGDVELLLEGSEESGDIQFVSATHPALHPGKSAEIQREGKTLGMVGALHPRIIKALDIHESTFVFELDLTGLHKKMSIFKDFSKFPAIHRDIAIVVDQGVFAQEIKSAIVKSAGPWLREVRLFDVYQGPGIEPGKKSVALGLILQHPSRTLIEEEVTNIVKELVNRLVKQFHAILRE